LAHLDPGAAPQPLVPQVGAHTDRNHLRRPPLQEAAGQPARGRTHVQSPHTRDGSDAAIARGLQPAAAPAHEPRRRGGDDHRLVWRHEAGGLQRGCTADGDPTRRDQVPRRGGVVDESPPDELRVERATDRCRGSPRAQRVDDELFVVFVVFFAVFFVGPLALVAVLVLFAAFFAGVVAVRAPALVAFSAFVAVVAFSAFVAFLAPVAFFAVL